MPKGNPNPSPATRFKPGQSGNPSGKSSEQLVAENEAARISATLRLAALSCLQEKVNTGELSPDELISSDNLRLFKDSEDRAHGQPDQNVNANVNHRAAAEAKVDAILDAISERGGDTGGASD